MFLSRVDKTVSRSVLEITINHDTGLPEKIEIVLLTGVKGTDGKDDRRLEDEEHVAIHFNYALGAINEVASFDIPAPARKIMR